MKKYVKPELFFESYELSQNIAACGWDMSNSGDPMQCTAVGDSGYGNDPTWGRGFLEANDNCEFKVENYCYENSADNVTMKIFNS